MAVLAGAGSFGAERLSTQGISCSVSSKFQLDLPNVTQCKFNCISSITCNNYRSASAFGMILRIAVRIQMLGVGTPFLLVQNVYGNAVPTQKCLWERRSHAFPHHYTPASTAMEHLLSHDHNAHNWPTKHYEQFVFKNESQTFIDSAG